MKWTSLYALTVVLVLFGLAKSTQGDISEYFLRDPYDQLDLFRQSNLRTKDTAAASDTKDDEEAEEKTNDNGLYDEYYDYLYDVGVLPSTKETTTSTTTEKPTTTPSPPRIQPRISSLTVADDVLGRVKKPKVKRRKASSKKRYNYRPHHRDNVATEAEPIKRQGKPVPHRNFAQAKPASKLLKPHQSGHPRDLPGLENVERLIPSSLKTVIEDSGKRIIKAVMQPVNTLNNIPRNTRIKETTFSSKMESWLQPYRSYFGYMAPTFAPDHITSFLVTQWVSTISITIAWITVGYLWQTMVTGRSSEGRSLEPWENLVPDSGTMATVLFDLSEAAARWHDEL